MKLADLIDKLVEIHNSKPDYNPDVTIMQETTLPPHLPHQGEKQVESLVKDVAVSSDRVIIIGNELD